MLTEEELDKLTAECGGIYNLNHTKRLLKIIAIIGSDYDYDQEIVTLAAYLHDWGAYEPYVIKGYDHAQRSAEVAAEFLEKVNIENSRIVKIAECIRFHHIGHSNKSIEAKLFSDADGIDFVGTVGVIRNFTTRPNELKKAFDAAKRRMEIVMENICLESSRPLIQKRIERAKILLDQFEEETFGIF